MTVKELITKLMLEDPAAEITIPSPCCACVYTPGTVHGNGNVVLVVA